MKTNSKDEAIARIFKIVDEGYAKAVKERDARRLEAERAAAKRKLVDAEVVAGPWPRRQLSQEDLWRRQQEIDFWWQRHLDEKAEEERYRTCHRGPGDSDWNLR